MEETITNTYARAYTEVYEILKYMNKEDVKICGLIENIKFTGVLS